MFIFGCIGTRSLFIIITKTINIKYLPFIGYIALLPAIGFIYIYLTGARKTGIEVGGDRIWWNNIRPLHSLLYFIFAYNAIHKNKQSWIYLLIDLIIGVVSFTIHHITNLFIIEQLTNNNNNKIILIGDSVLNNSNYVNYGQSVLDNIQLKTSNVLNFAIDGATITDTFQQLDKIETSFNRNDTFIFISVGGNNILNSKSYLKNKAITNIFKQYTQLIQTIKIKLPKANIVILNLYQPTNSRYKPYYADIDKWNQLIQENYKLGYKIILTNKLFVSPDHFIYDIEPSSKGAKILGKQILNIAGY